MRTGVSAALLLGAAVGTAFLARGCSPAPAPVPVPPPPPPPAAAPAAPAPPAPITVTFTDLDGEVTGFGPVNHTGIPDDKNWIAEAMGGASILFDYDGDGDVDILFVDGNVLAREPVPEARSRLFRNDGGMRFTDVTEASGIDLRGIGYGGAAADYDGDGDQDVFVGVLGHDHLLRNNGDGTFTDVAKEAGVAGGEREMTTACCWADFNGDGWLDLYASNYVDMYRVIDEFKAAGRGGRDCEWRGFKVYCGPMRFPFQKDRLHISNGPDPKTGVVTFRDRTGDLLDQVARPSFQPVAADYDRDGDMDVYVAVDTEPNHLWINDGKGVFRDDGALAGAAYGALVQAQAGMGNDVADYDHDGLLDMTVTNFSHDYNTVYQNRSVPRKDGKGLKPSFEDVTVRLGVNGPTYLHLGWLAAWTDFDNDGDKDLCYSNGHVYGQIDNFKETGTSYRQANLLLESSGGRTPIFRDVSAQAGPAFRREEVHRGGAWADLDDDGDEDFVHCVLNGRAYIARNDGGNRNSWIRISLEGKKPRDPAGALVKVEAEGLLPQWDVTLRGDSFCSASDRRLHFGLGTAAKATKVTVTWPSGATSEFSGLDARAHWLLVEGDAKPRRQAK